MHVTMSNKFGMTVKTASANAIKNVWIKSEYFMRKRQTKTQVKQRNYFSTKKIKLKQKQQ